MRISDWSSDVCSSDLADTPVAEALVEMSSKGMGMAIVLDDNRKPVGIFTDGDLRRLIARHGDIRPLSLLQGMIRDPKTIGQSALAVEAATHMDTGRRNLMLVVAASGKCLGAYHRANYLDDDGIFTR